MTAGPEQIEIFRALMDQASAYALRIGHTFIEHHKDDGVDGKIVVLALVYLAAAGDCDLAPERPDEAERFAAMCGAVMRVVRQQHSAHLGKGPAS